MPRDEIFLTAKIWKGDLSPTAVLSNTEESLRFLGTDSIDLLLIHWPNSEIPLEDTLEAMVKLKEQGKISHLGVSNFPPSLLKKACDLAPVFCNQVEYHPFPGQSEVLGIARQRDLLVTAYSPLAQGVVSRPPDHLEGTEAAHRGTPTPVLFSHPIQDPPVQKALLSSHGNSTETRCRHPDGQQKLCEIHLSLRVTSLRRHPPLFRETHPGWC